MSNTKKISFNMIAADMKREDDTITVQFDGLNRQYEIGVKRNLDFRNAMKFVRDIVSSCSDIETGEYTPEGFDFAIRANVLVYYAGFTEPTDISKAYEVVYTTGLFDSVMSVIDKRQCDILIKAAKDRLEYAKEYMIVSQSSKINDLVGKMDEVMQDGNHVLTELTTGDLKAKIDDMLQAMSVIGEQSTATEAPDNIVELPVSGRE